MQVQPVGAFATKGAAPGYMLSKLILSAVLKLEGYGFRVLGCTCDGATTNKSMWREFGIGKPEDGTKVTKFKVGITFEIILCISDLVFMLHYYCVCFRSSIPVMLPGVFIFFQIFLTQLNASEIIY